LDGRKDRGKTVYPPPPSGSGGIIIYNNKKIYINTFVVLAASEAISVLSDKRQVIVEENKRGR
jgi:hypothetical protein